MLTNAILITEEVAEMLCRNMSAVTISLDGHEKHMHDYYRGKNTFEPTVRGIRRLVAKKKEMGLARPYIAIVPALTERNIVDMKEIFEFSLDDLGASGLAPIIFQAGDHQEVNISQIPALDVYLEALDRTYEYMKSRDARNWQDGSASGFQLGHVITAAWGTVRSVSIPAASSIPASHFILTSLSAETCANTTSRRSSLSRR